MPERCARTFDEAMLSGYVDGELTQGDEQHVRIHLEDCAACRTQVEDMQQLREVTMTSRFNVPADDQWSEAPRGTTSRLAFGLGWTFLIVWVSIVAGFGLWQFWTSDEPIAGKLLAFAPVSAVTLLFLSVLIDRVKAMRTDPYRRVQK
jgi:predicted anti-sigma-YlaC factor YlaD